jgi:cell division protein FtsA
MAQLIAEQVEKAGPPSSFPGGIVLTGGGALLRGFAEVIQQVTDLPARVAAPHGVTGMNDEISGPHHATVVGLLRWGARGRMGRGVQLTGRAQNGNGQHVGDRFGRWIRELF